jgi:hypothetical protein
MRSEEKFAGESLVQYLGGPTCASISDGNDPPDLFLSIGAERIGVEVTRLSQFTFEADGGLGNRATQDAFASRLIDEFDAEFGPLLPDNVSLLIGLWVPVADARAFRKTLRAWVQEVAGAPPDGYEHERNIVGARVRLRVIPRRASGRRIVGYISNANSSADIDLNARVMLENRIRTKNEVCACLSGRVWLALLNDYWLADHRTYVVASRALRIAHCFERILLVSDGGGVMELAVAA